MHRLQNHSVQLLIDFLTVTQVPRIRWRYSSDRSNGDLTIDEEPRCPIDSGRTDFV